MKKYLLIFPALFFFVFLTASTTIYLMTPHFNNLESDNPDTNENTYVLGWFSYNPTGPVIRKDIYLPDLSGIPAGSTINSVQFWCYSYASNDQSGHFHRVLSANSSWTPTTSTWNHRTTGVSWAGSAGCSTAGTDYATADMCPSPFQPTYSGSGAWYYYTLDNTEFANLVNNNYGFIIQKETTDVYRYWLYSQETYDGNTPYLVVDFSTPAPTNTPTPATTNTYTYTATITLTATNTPTHCIVTQDSFHGPNSSFSMGSPVIGNTWIPVLGQWGIIGNYAYAPGSPVYALTVSDSGISDGIITTTLNTVGPRYGGIVFRYQDPNNYWVFFEDPTPNQQAIVIGYFQNGQFTELDAWSNISTNGDVLTVYLSGSTISYWINGYFLNSISNSFLQTSTWHGLFAGNDNGTYRWSNYSVTMNGNGNCVSTSTQTQTATLTYTSTQTATITQTYTITKTFTNTATVTITPTALATFTATVTNTPYHGPLLPTKTPTPSF